MIKIVEGDLLSVKEGIIGHQVNCQGVMGSGVAFQVKRRYPSAFTSYKMYIDDFVNMNVRDSLLGTINFVEVKEEKLWIANMFGQDEYGSGKQFTNTEKLYLCFKELREVAEERGLSVHLPYMIGCYRGGADWKEVENLLLIAFRGYEVTLHKYHEG